MARTAPAIVLACVAVSLVSLVSLAGCSEDPSIEGFDRLTVRLHNQGSTAMTVPFTITADEATIFSESITVAGGARVERSVDAVPGASYVLRAHYHADEPSQNIDAERIHTLEPDDCPPGTVRVTFQFSYTSTDQRKAFSRGTSWGDCLDDA